MPFSILDEDQEYAILKAMVENNINILEVRNLPPEIYKLIGEGGEGAILGIMDHRGLIIDKQGQHSVFHFTNSGRARYKQLRWKRICKRIQGFISWLTFIVVVVSGIYSVLTYYKPDNKSDSDSNSDSIKINQPLIKKSHTVDGISKDSLSKKDTNKIFVPSGSFAKDPDETTGSYLPKLEFVPQLTFINQMIL